ncbi:MAG: sensor histidine kinase [Anaerolineaceae bacterium]|nr:sensor histidine kinase [Anaerolineaceae bacterium]
MKELSLHILDIAENSISASSSQITIAVLEDIVNDRLRICITDNGKGMSTEMAQKIMDPFVTSRTTRKVGLGIPLLKAAAEMCDGFLTIESQPGIGTKVTVEFQRSHIDRMPMGDLTTTILQLVVSNPQINFIFIYSVNELEYIFDDNLLKQELYDLSLTEPSILNYIKDQIETGYHEIHPEVEY